MSLTAKEWLLLSEEEQEKRGDELSYHECFLLRTLYSHTHFSEKQKENMTEEQKQKFLKEKEIVENKKDTPIKTIDDMKALFNKKFTE